MQVIRGNSLNSLVELAVAFAASLAAVIAVALLFRAVGKKPNYLNIVAIPIGITLAEALRLAWPVPEYVFPFVLGATVGAAVGVAQLVGMRRGT